MKVLSNNATVRSEQGFAVYVLSNNDTEVAIVPELGARIISLKNRRSGREWMWHPSGGLSLFQNRPGDAFANGPLVGMDECLPTIEPCVWRGRQLPDHGEVWTAAWTVDAEAWKSGVIKTSVSLSVSPFNFERSIELEENEIRISYQLTNRSSTLEYFLWAMHPLLRLQPDDRLVLPPSTRELMNGARWVDAIGADVLKGDSSKVFAGPLKAGFAAIHSGHADDRLEFEWTPAENNGLGLWLTRGGWHGHDHFAIEPTNSGADALTTAVAREWCGTLDGASSATWQVRLRVR